MPTKEEQAAVLARKHYEIDLGLTHVYRIKTTSADIDFGPVEPIRLLEVNENTVESGILPVYFGPSPALGLSHPSVILEVTPAEFDKIRRDELKLPEGWEVGDLISKPDSPESL